MLKSKIESILFVASAPLALKKIAKALGVSLVEVENALEILISEYNHDDSGIHLVKTADEVQMVTNAQNNEVVEKFVKSEISGELTKPQLETLTVVAYRAPVTRPELEKIRGVNCSIILRNLMQRGLILEEEKADEIMPYYNLSVEAFSHLGIKAISELPNYTELHTHEYLEKTLENKE